MQWGKVKNILIVILVAVNAFLLCNLGVKQWQDWERVRELQANLGELLSGYGIELDASFRLPGDTVLPTLSVDRSRTSEEAVAAAALGGELERTEREDGAVLLEGASGSLEWQADGRLQGECATGEPAPEEEKQAQRLAQRLLEKWGLASDDAAYTADGLSVTMTGTAAGLPVFNRQISLRFDGQGGAAVSGLWSFGTPYTTVQASGTVCVASDALLAFAANGQDCTRITSMTIGYRLQSDSGRRLQLMPTWKIGTDSGDYLVDCAKKTILEQEN